MADYICKDSLLFTQYNHLFRMYLKDPLLGSAESASETLATPLTVTNRFRIFHVYTINHLAAG